MRCSIVSLLGVRHRFVDCQRGAAALRERTAAMSIKLKPDVERRLVASIQRYCADNLDDEMGELKAKLLLDFCVREIGPSVYNQAVLDAQAAMHDKVAEIDTVCYQAEFGYWKK